MKLKCSEHLFEKVERLSGAKDSRYRDRLRQGQDPSRSRFDGSKWWHRGTSRGKRHRQVHPPQVSLGTAQGVERHHRFQRPADQQVETQPYCAPRAGPGHSEQGLLPGIDSRGEPPDGGLHPQ